MTHPDTGGGGTNGPGREVQTFQFGDLPLRTVMVGNDPWFVGRDACEVLAIADARSSLNLLDEDERDSIPVIDSMGRSQQTIIISEAGLYSLILRSRKPEAKAFKRWITHEVLPALRRTGRYEVTPALPQSYSEALRELAAQVEETERARAQLAIAAPKAEYVDGFVDVREDASTLRVFANQLGTTEPKLREYLRGRKVLSRRVVDNRWSSSRGRMEPVYQWLPYADHRAWFVAKDQPEAPRLHNGQMRTTLYVTPVGKVQIRRLLMKHPIDGMEAAS